MDFRDWGGEGASGSRYTEHAGGGHNTAGFAFTEPGLMKWALRAAQDAA
jgi:hypothetical protein